MSKSKNHDLLNGSCTKKENKNANDLNKQIDQQAKVQQRYQSELIKYQEQINKIKQSGSCDNRAA
jgi:flagellar basal body rod protein FlgB